MFKVITVNGGFFASPLTSAALEARASVEARTRTFLLGVQNGHPSPLDPSRPVRDGDQDYVGLSKTEALALASRLSRARVRGATRARLGGR